MSMQLFTYISKCWFASVHTYEIGEKLAGENELFEAEATNGLAGNPSFFLP